jgi:molybdenum cofactor cytidylyltransferase
MPLLTSITPVILAAGGSMRMGYPKALLPLESDCFLTWILKVVKNSGLGKPTVVLGKNAREIQSRIQEWQVDILINTEPERGQLSSIQMALSSLPPESVAAMVWPVDQPLVSVYLVDNLAHRFFDSSALIAYPIYGERLGHPAIFHRELFQEFMEAPLDEGPKRIITNHQADTAVLPTDEPGTVYDFDTPSDYEAAFGKSLDSVVTTNPPFLNIQ